MADAIEPGTSREAALASLAARFAAAGVEAPRREATLLLRRAAELSAAALISAPEAVLGQAAARVEAFARRREAGEPLSRIEGRREFFGRDFKLTPDVLDPRADTEALVEAALTAFASRSGEALSVLDLGVGSGAILGALLCEWPRARGVGVDISPPAAATARANLETLGLGERASVRIGRWGEGLAGRFDVIVSNPPYVRSGDIAGLAREVARHDPLMALDGGQDGLDAYRALAPQMARLIAPRGRFFLEIGAGQGEEVVAILARARLQVDVRRRDLAGIERVIGGGDCGLAPAGRER